MKNVALFLCFLVCACKGITYWDVNPNVQPNTNLLPALEPVVDINNLETTYSAGGVYSVANNFGSIYAQNPRWANWAQTTTMNTTAYKDARVSDVINIFEKEVKENISSPYGTRKGYISLKLGYRGTGSALQYYIPSILSLGTLNLLGFPFDQSSQSLEVQVEIWNNKREMVKRYVETVYDDQYVAMYWGYNEQDVWRKLAADNIKHALENIRFRINGDASEIKKMLK